MAGEVLGLQPRTSAAPPPQGLETATTVLGHSTAGIAEQYYAEVDLERAASVIKRIG